MIVRLGGQNRMVTKGYQKGVYEWVTSGTKVGLRADQLRPCHRRQHKDQQHQKGWFGQLA